MSMPAHARPSLPRILPLSYFILKPQRGYNYTLIFMKNLMLITWTFEFTDKVRQLYYTLSVVWECASIVLYTLHCTAHSLYRVNIFSLWGLADTIHFPEWQNNIRYTLIFMKNLMLITRSFEFTDNVRQLYYTPSVVLRMCLDCTAHPPLYCT